VKTGSPGRNAALSPDDVVEGFFTLLKGYETQVQEYCKGDKEAGAHLKNAVDTAAF